MCVCVRTISHLAAAYRKVVIKGVGGIALAPGPGPSPMLAAFIPEVKGGPAGAAIFRTEPGQGAAPGAAVEPAPLVRKNFFRTQGEGEGEGGGRG